MFDSKMLTDFIRGRNASSKLTAPAPTAKQLDDIFSAAFRAPDHANLTPARFKVIHNQGLDALGALFVRAESAQADAPLSAERKAKLLAMPKRAPMIIVVSAYIQTHEKVPAIEQMLSTACSVQNILLAIEALHYHAIWRTGALAYNTEVHKGLGLKAQEELLGFIYVGTRKGRAKKVQPTNAQRFVSHWPDPRS